MLQTRSGGAWCPLLQAGTDPRPVAPPVECRPWGKGSLGSAVGSATDQWRVSGTSCFPGGSAGQGTSPGDALLLGTHTTLCHRPLLRVKRGSSSLRGRLVTAVPFPQPDAWWQGHSTSGEGWSGSKSSAICFCGGRSRAPCFGTSPLPCSSLELEVGDADEWKGSNCWLLDKDRSYTREVKYLIFN